MGALADTARRVSGWRLFEEFECSAPTTADPPRPRRARSRRCCWPHPRALEARSRARAAAALPAPFAEAATLRRLSCPPWNLTGAAVGRRARGPLRASGRCRSSRAARRAAPATRPPCCRWPPRSRRSARGRTAARRGSLTAVRRVRIHDTLSGGRRELEPREPPKVGIYACGPTVYGRVHVGNARPFVVFALLQPLPRARGLRADAGGQRHRRQRQDLRRRARGRRAQRAAGPRHDRRVRGRHRRARPRPPRPRAAGLGGDRRRSSR